MAFSKQVKLNLEEKPSVKANKAISDYTGMKRTAVASAALKGKTSNYKGAAYKDKLDIISEGDKKVAKKIEKTFKKTNK